MKTYFRILHVDDDDRWRYTVKDFFERVFKNVGCEVLSFENLDEAKARADNPVDVIDLCIIDGSIHQNFDGEKWAEERARTGKEKETILLSGFRSDECRAALYVNKGSFGNGEPIANMIRDSFPWIARAENVLKDMEKSASK